MFAFRDENRTCRPEHWAGLGLGLVRYGDRDLELGRLPSLGDIGIVNGFGEICLLCMAGDLERPRCSVSNGTERCGSRR